MADRKATFNLPENDIKELQRLAKERGTTVTAALRRAIATETFVNQEIKKGSKLLVEKADGTIREIVIVG